jgi:AraC-like DNA-binding protein
MKPFYQKLVTPPSQSVIIFNEEKPHFTVPWHFHPEIEILFVVKSSGTSYIGDCIESFNAGDITIIGENVPHWWKSDSKYLDGTMNEGIKALIIQFDKDIFGANFINTPEMSPIKDLLEKSMRGIKFIGKSREILGKQMMKIFRVKGVHRITELILLLDLMADSNEYKFHSSLGYSKILNSYDFYRFNKIHEFLVTNFTRPISLDDISRIINMSPTALCRYFKKHTGKTLFAFLNEIRIGHACKLMIEENVSISNASYESGYNNLSHFNYQFKRMKKVTPSEYVSAYKNGQVVVAG